MGVRAVCGLPALTSLDVRPSLSDITFSWDDWSPTRRLLTSVVICVTVIVVWDVWRLQGAEAAVRSTIAFAIVLAPFLLPGRVGFSRDVSFPINHV